MSTTTVVGGGLSGLAAAYYLLRRTASPSNISVYEASNRIGGWLRTERHRDKDFIFEMGPRTIRPKGQAGANTLEMIEELQLPLDAIPSSHVAARNRLIYAKGQLCMLPNSLSGIFRTLPPFTKPLVSAVLHDLRSKAKMARFGDESIYDFVERRFGTEVAKYAIAPLICGICAGNAKEISVRFLLDDLYEKEQRWGGVVKGLLLSRLNTKKAEIQTDGLFAEGNYPPLYEKALREKWSMYRVQKGLEQLPRTLGDYLRQRDVNIEVSAECREMTFTKEGVQLSIKGRDTVAEHVICALPAYKLASCVKDQHPSLSAQLLTIPYVDVAVVNLQYPTAALQGKQAFGFLVPPSEERPILGVIFDSCCFEMGKSTVLTVMMGGHWFEHYFGRHPSPKELLDTALEQVSSILQIKQEPRMTRVHILHKCIPQYTVGHKQRVIDIRRYIQRYNLPLSLCGAAYDGVGINDVILSARRQVDALYWDE